VFLFAAPDAFLRKDSESEKILEINSTNLASETKTAQVLQTDLLPGGNSRAPVSHVSNSNWSPLWLSTTGYFLIAGTISLGLFVIVWGLLHDEGESETLWIPAAIALSVMSLATAAREVILRRAQTRYLLSHEQFGPTIIPARVKNKTEKKFTLEQNSTALRLIKSKADEADLTLATAEKHLEVFKASQEYLEIVKNELHKVQAGSPRLPALRKGIKTVEVLHKHHLLRWAAEETRRLIREASILVLTNEKIITAHQAIETLDFALKFYPDEKQLISSKIAVEEFTISARITHWIELAEREAFKGHYRRAIDHYQDALFYLSREPLYIQENDFVKVRLEDEIEKLNAILLSKKGTRKKLSPKK
jgi:tetratricopeptide (TPR) repeat protein